MEGKNSTERTSERMGVAPKRPLSVAMLTALFPPSVGGIQTHTLALSRALVKQGHRVHVITRRHGELPERSLIDGVEVHRVGAGDAPRALATASFLTDGLALLQRMRGELDVLHAHQMLSPMTLGLAARLGLELPLVVTPHASGPIGDVQQLTDARRVTGALRLAGARSLVGAFAVISPEIHGELLGIGVPPERLVPLANGVDAERFRPPTAKERAQARQALGAGERPTVVSVGRLSPEKGQDVLLEAWAKLVKRAPHALLLLAGEGELRGRLEARTRELDLTGSVRFLGSVDAPESLLWAADVFCLPSRTEGLSIALLEAMASGASIVATRVGATPDALEGKGRLVPPGSAKALVGALEHALDEARSGGAGGHRAEAVRLAALKRFTLESSAARHARLYASLCGGERMLEETSGGLREVA